MAQTPNLVIRRDGRDYGQLPVGVSRFIATNAGTVTGAATSTVAFLLDFNPASDPNFQQYVGITKVALKTTVAALVIVGVSIQLANLDWEDNQLQPRPIGAFTMTNYQQAADYAGIYDVPVYVGRTAKGTPGRFTVQVQEILNTVYEISVSGLMSEKPFLMPDWMRA